jgi:cytochrome c-type biogenesis protein CcmH/NrfF
MFLRAAGLASAAAVFPLTQAEELSADLITPEVKRVGVRLRCLCGCAMTVGECNMVGCHYASPARIEIREMLASGMSDDAIVEAFVKKEGIRALAAPPAQGFNWFGYTMPYILAALGAVFLGFFLQRLKRRPAAFATPNGATPNGAPIPDVPAPDRFQAAAAKAIEEIED